MSESETRTGMVAAMYGQDDEAEAREAAQRQAKAAADEVRRTGRSCMIRIDGREVEVPTTAYVRQLERTVEELKRTTGRLEQMLRDSSRLVNRQAQDISGLRSDISRAKWDV